MEKSLENYWAAIELSPNDQEAAHGLARMCFKKGDWENASRFYGQVIESPNDLAQEDLAEAYLHAGEALTKLGQTETAAVYLDWVAEKSPELQRGSKRQRQSR